MGLSGDRCNRRSIKCSKSDDPSGRCQNCVDFDVPCTFNRPIKRRGVKSNRTLRPDGQGVQAPIASSYSTEARSQPDLGRRESLSSDPWTPAGSLWSGLDPSARSEYALSRSWTAFAIACDRTIRNLMEVYFEIVYPM